VLTDGYANALAMDRRPHALERRIAELALKAEDPVAAAELRSWARAAHARRTAAAVAAVAQDMGTNPRSKSK